MGGTHALSGVAAALAATPLIEAAYRPLTLPELALAAVLGAGAAMVPDLDHPHATFARTYGPLTRVLSWVVSRVSGGHRNGTHSLLGVLVFTAGAWAATLSPVAAGVVVWLLAGVAARAFGVSAPVHPVLTETVNAIMVAAATVALVAFAPHLLWVLPWCVAAGTLAHIIGDCVTGTGCPLAWPLSQYMVGVPLVDTGGKRETYLVVPALALGVLVLGADATGLVPLLDGPGEVLSPDTPGPAGTP